MKKVLQRIAGALLAAVMTLGLVPMGRAEAISPPGDIVNQKDLPTSLANGYSEKAGEYEIYPVPHSVVYEEDKTAAERTRITLAKAVNVVIGEGVDEATRDYLKEITDAYGLTWSQSTTVDQNKTNILLGIHGKTNDLAAQQCGEPQQYDDLFTASDETVDGKYEPYILKVTAGANNRGLIAVSGLDTTAVYRGVGTIAMLFSSFAGKYLVPVTIEDYSNDIIRGFIEGFYGDFTYDARASQMKAIRTVKGNMYVFASKTDKYHGEKWDQQYPNDELAKIKELVDLGEKYKVEYAWSVHLGKGNFFQKISDKNFDASPSKDNGKYQANLEKLEAKFEQLYNIGVRNFHILNDDANSGSYEDAARLVTDIAKWLKTKDGCGPLVYCCNGYNTSWQNGKGELEKFKDVPDNVYFYWTGANVQSSIKQDNVNVVNNKSNHYAVTWLNYPCSEHAKNSLFLGEISYQVKEADKMTKQAGLMSNPVDYPEANLVAYFQLLSWSWNRDEYTRYMTELWEDSFKYLAPEVWQSYLTVARNVSDCTGSSKVPGGFPESEYLKTTIESITTKVNNGASLKGDGDVEKLLAELQKMRDAVTDIRKHSTNTELKKELEPFLKALWNIADAIEYGIKALISLEEGKLDAAIANQTQGAASLSLWGTDKVSNPDDAYPTAGAKSGGKRLQPLARRVIEAAAAKLETSLGLNKNAATGEKRFIGKLGETDISGSIDDAIIKKMFDGDESTSASWTGDPYNKTAVGDYYGVDLGSVQVVTGIYIHQSADESKTGDFFRKARVQYSENDVDWVDLTSTLDTRVFNLTGLSVKARYVRLYRDALGDTGSPNKKDYNTVVREFQVTVAKSTAAVFTNSAAPGAVLTENGTSYTLDGGNVTLRPGEYVGMEFTKLAEVASASAAVTGDLKVYVSHTPETWSELESGTAAAKYVVIKNDGADSYTGQLPALSVTLANPLLEPGLAAAKVGGKTDGSNLTGDWANLFDGDRSTCAGTAVTGAGGDYVILDLGAAIHIQSITVVAPENGDFPDASGKLAVSVGNSADPQGTWQPCGNLPVVKVGEGDQSHRVATMNINVTGRYIKIQHNSVATNKMTIYEIEINGKSGIGTSASAFSGSPAVDFKGLTDGSLSTAVDFGKVAEGGYLEYLISENNNVTDIKIIQDASRICMAPVQVKTADGTWKNVGKLDTVVSTLHVGQVITALRIDWPAGSSPCITEVAIEGTGSGVSAAGAPLEVPDIQSGTIPAADITVNYGTPAEMVGLPVQARATLTSGKEVVLPLKWSCANYNPMKPGKYTFTGTYDTSGLELNNSTGLSATATVEVLAQNTAPAAAAAEPVDEPATESVIEPADEPMALASTATAPEMPEGSVDLIGNAGGEASERKVYVSGREDDSHPASKIVDGVLDEDKDSSTNRWCSNATKKPNNENPPSWLVIDLGEEVTDITLVEIHFYKKVWPTKFKIQVSNEWEPVDFYNINKKSISDWKNNDAFKGDNAADAACWKTICEVTDHRENNHPTHTITKDGETNHQFTEGHISTPVTGRYLRVLFEEINEEGADCIGVKELYVYGTRASSSGTPEQGPEQPSEPIDLLGNRTKAVSPDRVYVSGCETGAAGQGKAKAVNNDEASHWSSNKQRESKTSPQDCPAWIVVDLGDGVTDITKVELKFNKMVWPKGFAIQVSDSWEPQDFSQKNIGHVSNENEAFTGQNAKNDDCWTTVFSIESHTEGNGPRHIVSKTDDKGGRFLEDYLTNPIKGKYLRVYFDTVNEQAGGNSIGLQEIYVEGTRAATEEPDPVEPPDPGPSEPVSTEIEAATEVEATAVKGHVSEAELPQKVNVTLEDGTKVTLPVTWNLEGVGTESGSVTVTGTIGTGAGCESYTVTNGKDIRATLNLTIIDVPTATAVLVNPNSRTVWAGTGFDALYLPARVTVQLSNGMVAVAEASWNRDSYAPDRAGDQTVTGSVTIPSGEYQGVALNGLDLKFPVTVKALNTPEQITVSFETNGGEEIKSQTLSYGGTLTSLPQPGPKGGRAFEDWYLDAGFRTKWDGRNLYFSTTLYAKFAGEGEEELPDVQVQSGGTTSSVDENLDQSVAGAVESAVKSTGFSEGAADGAVKTAVEAKAAAAVESLSENKAEWEHIQETLEADPENINIFAVPYLDITVGADGYKADGTSYTLDITPRYYVIATTASNAASADETNSVKLADGTLALTKVQVEIVLPAGFAEKGDTVYVFPEGEKTNYKACTVQEGCKVVYTAPHFSKFTVTRERPYTAPAPGPVVPPTPSTPSTPGGTSPSAKFIDVDQKGWYINSVNYVLERGLMKGVGDTEFAPEDDLTRAELVTVLHRLAGEPAAAAASFTDVKDEWFADAVAWAAANEIVTGYGNGKFGPDDPMTREQAAAILYRYAKYKNYNIAVTGSLDGYTDVGKINDWAVDAMKWCNSHGIITGETATTLAPRGTATRAEVATILERFCKNIVK